MFGLDGIGLCMVGGLVMYGGEELAREEWTLDDGKGKWRGHRSCRSSRPSKWLLWDSFDEDPGVSPRGRHDEFRE